MLLPLDIEDHANISVLRCVEGKDGESLTLFLKDTTEIENEKDEFFQAGFLAFCDKIDNEDFFVATVYHEWFLFPRGQIDTSIHKANLNEREYFQDNSLLQ